MGVVTNMQTCQNSHTKGNIQIFITILIINQLIHAHNLKLNENNIIYVNSILELIFPLSM